MECCIARFCLGLLLIAYASSTKTLLRTKRIDDTAEKSTHIRTKRIEDESKEKNNDEIRIRTKRIHYKINDNDNTEKTKKKLSEIRTKRIDKQRIKTAPLKKKVELKKAKAETEIDNDINNLRQALLGSCRGQKLNQTFSEKNCEDVTMESLVCGGVCESQIQPFNDITDINDAFDKCTFCGPLEYEEKLVILQCYSGNVKRRRWKIEVRKLFIPKTCGCLKESCHKLNAVSREQHQQENSFL